MTHLSAFFTVFFFYWGLQAQDLDLHSVSRSYEVQEDGQYALAFLVTGVNNSDEDVFYHVFDSELERLEDIHLEILNKSKWKEVKLKNLLRLNLSTSFKSDFVQLAIPMPSESRFRLRCTYKCTQSMLISKVQTQIKDVDSISTTFLIPKEWEIFVHNDSNEFKWSDSAEIKSEKILYKFENFSNESNGNSKSVPILVKPKEQSPQEWFGNWYQSHLKNVSEIINLSEELFVFTGNDTVQFVSSIFNLIQEKISYVDFEDGLGAFIPRPAQKTWENKYGDCKDMSFLIHSILRANGIKSNLAISKTLSLSDKFDFPSISLANHCVCLAYFNNREYILDATDRECDFGLPSQHIEGTEILVIDGSQTRFRNVPVTQAQKNLDSTYLFINFNENEKVNYSRVFTGYPSNLVQYSEDQKSTVIFDLSDEYLVEKAEKFYSIKDEPILKRNNVTQINDQLIIPADFLFTGVPLIIPKTKYKPLYSTLKKVGFYKLQFRNQIEKVAFPQLEFKTEHIEYKIGIKLQENELQINEVLIINQPYLHEEEGELFSSFIAELEGRKSKFINITFK